MVCAMNEYEVVCVYGMDAQNWFYLDFWGLT